MPLSMQEGIRAIERAQAEIARIRGWSRRGAHDRAAQALDAALCAVEQAKRDLRDAPYAAQALAALDRDLDAITGGS